jgi:hypothetical protein
MNSGEKLTRVNDTDTEQNTVGMNGTQPKKPYRAPRLIEHGNVEKITGFLVQCIGSGCIAY